MKTLKKKNIIEKNIDILFSSKFGIWIIGTLVNILIFYISNQIFVKKRYEPLLEKNDVFVLKNDIPKGTRITKDDVFIRQVPALLVQTIEVTKVFPEDGDFVAAIDLKKGDILLDKYLVSKDSFENTKKTYKYDKLHNQLFIMNSTELHSYPSFIAPEDRVNIYIYLGGKKDPQSDIQPLGYGIRVVDVIYPNTPTDLDSLTIDDISSIKKTQGPPVLILELSEEQVKKIAYALANGSYIELTY